MKKLCIGVFVLVFFAFSPLFAAFQSSTLNGDEIVTDTKTGLVWQKTYVNGKTWQQALYYCENLTYAGHSDQIPFKYTLAVPHGYFSKTLSAEYDVRHVAKKYANEGIVSVKSDLGNDLRLYCIERTLCELLHKPSELNKERFIPAIRKYTATPEKDFLLLMKFGRIFHVEKKLLSYLEAIQ